MRRIPGLSLVAAAVLLAGCAEEQRPIKVAKRVETQAAAAKPVEIPAMTAPAASDPAAAAVIRAALQAHTGGRPELLEKFKAPMSVKREGQMWNAGPYPMAVKWEAALAWPDRYRYTMLLPSGDTLLLAAAGDKVWRFMGGQRLDLAGEEAKDVRESSSAEWLGFLFPLADPAARFAPAENTTVNEKPAVGVRVWAPKAVDAVLHFDAESKLLVQVSFNGREQGKDVVKQSVFLTHKPYHGVTLGDKTVLRVQGQNMYEWSTSVIELDAKIDPKTYEQP